MGCFRDNRSASSRAAAGGRRGSDFVEGGNHRLGKRRIVQIVRQTDQLAIGVAAKEGTDRLEQSLVGRGGPEWFVTCIDQRDATFRYQEVDRPFHSVPLFGGEGAAGVAFFRGGPRH